MSSERRTQEINETTATVEERVSEPKDEKALLRERLERELREKIARRNQKRQLEQTKAQQDINVNDEAVETNIDAKQSEINKQPAVLSNENDLASQRQQNMANEGILDTNEKESIKEKLERELKEKIANRTKAKEIEVQDIEELGAPKTEEDTSPIVVMQGNVSGDTVVGSMILGDSAIQQIGESQGDSTSEEDRQHEEESPSIIEEKRSLYEDKLEEEGAKEVEVLEENKEFVQKSEVETEPVKDEKKLLRERLERELRGKIERRKQKEAAENKEETPVAKIEEPVIVEKEDAHKTDIDRVMSDESSIQTEKQEVKPKVDKDIEDDLRKREELKSELIRQIEENDKLLQENAQEKQQMEKQPIQENKKQNNTVENWFKSGLEGRNEGQKEEQKRDTQVIDKEESLKNDKRKFLDVLAKYS